MLSRRDMLRTSLIALDLRPKTHQAAVIVEPHVLSQESGVHFQGLLCDTRVNRDLVILPGVKQLTMDAAGDLRRRASAGAWLVFESGLCFATAEVWNRQTSIWSSAFELRFQATQPTSELYVEYSWPRRQLIRSFDNPMTLAAGSGEVIARAGGVPVSCLQRLGHGGIVFLGSMLGPGLGAGEREAQQLARSIVEGL